MALGNMPGEIVPAPQALRRRYGLFDAASGPLDLPQHGEGAGIRYVPDTCGEAYLLGVNCYDGDDPAPTKPLDGIEDEVETGVFVALATVACTPVGYSTDELAERARRRLENHEQAAAERALWSGLDFEGNTLGIRSLNGEATDIPGGYDPGLITDVVGALERHAYTEMGYGSVAYLHAPIEVAAFAAEAGLIMADGNRKVTPLGSVWSFGAYPAGSVIVTGQTTVWRSPGIAVATAFDRITNGAIMVAERAYAVSFDCFAGRAEFDPLEVTSP